MMWDVVAVMVAAVLVNHMGLIDELERRLKRELPILNCVRCLTFWSVLLVMIFRSKSTTHVEVIVATSFVASFAAQWLELFFGFLSKIYERLYKKIYPQEVGKEFEWKKDDGAAYTANTTSEVSQLRWEVELNDE